MSTKYIIAIIVIVILGIGAYLVWGRNSNMPSTTVTTTATSDVSGTVTGSPISDTSKSSPATGTNTDQPKTKTGGSSVNAGTVVVDYTNHGFSPASVSIQAGQTVTFVDQSSNPMWIASDPHPVHTGYDGTDTGEHCAAGYAGPAPLDECATTNGSWSFTFTKIGTWGYHNHLAPNIQGTIMVAANPGSSVQ